MGQLFPDKGVTPIGQRVRKRDRIFRLLKDPAKADSTAFYCPQPTEEEGSAPAASPTLTPMLDSEVDGAKCEVSAKVVEFEAEIREIETDKNLKEKVKFSFQNWIGTR